ncbi:ankyrin repeat domain-containing protein 65-like isoform X2 [Ptychodera flava]|uniref:ankyrin repeat domain-containing protein 65-like isoform X2 n=1 Tax=Ptychodera flava TaxID=63121 RepID=UPI00396A756B
MTKDSKWKKKLKAHRTTTRAEALSMSVINERLLTAASEGKINEVTRLIKSGRCAINYVSDHGLLTPLHKAASNGHTTIVKVLLDCGANPNLKDKYGRTALHLAAINGRKTVTEVLVKRDARINMLPVEIMGKRSGSVYQNPWKGLTALHCACDWGHTGVVEIMINTKIDINVKDTEYGRTPLHLASVKGHTAVVDLLISAGADVNAEADMIVGMIWGSLVQHPWQQCTALQCATYWGHKDVVRSLVKAGAVLDAKDYEYGGTALHLACVRGHVGVVKALFEGTVHVNMKADVKVDKLCGSIFNNYWHNCTPLHCATFCGHKTIVALLLEHGAYVYSVDSERKTAYDIAIDRKNQELADLILHKCKEFLLNVQFVKYSERVGAGTRWKRLAVALFFPEDDIEKIEEMYKHMEAEERSRLCCMHVLKFWLDDQAAWPDLPEVEEAMQRVDKIGKGADVYFSADMSSDSSGTRRMSKYGKH